MKLVKSIKIVFEDCDSVCFDKRDLGIFNMEDIKCEIHGIGCGGITKNYYANTVVIEFLNDDVHVPFGALEDGKTTKFARIAEGADIMGIELLFPDESRDSYLVAHEGETKNAYQKTYISKLGHLYLVISKEKNIEDFINIDRIDSDDYREYLDMLTGSFGGASMTVGKLVEMLKIHAIPDDAELWIDNGFEAYVDRGAGAFFNKELNRLMITADEYDRSRVPEEWLECADGSCKEDDWKSLTG